MGKITKNAAFLEQLNTMIKKEATAGVATGKPGADTHYTEVSKEHEKVDKNKEGHPEHNPQEFKQEMGNDKAIKNAEATPTPEPEKVAEIAKEAKKEECAVPNTKPAEVAKEEAPTTIMQHEGKKMAAESGANEKLAQLGQQLLDTINEMQKSGEAGKATGKPSADTHYVSVSKETEKVNKNKEGHPEHNPQEFKQEKGNDKAIKNAEELELDKEASFELGRQFAREFLKSKTASVDANIYKEAGRRDFEALIATAAAELENENKVVAPKPVTKQANVNDAQLQKQAEEQQVKQAEEAGAQAFYALLKQAQEEEQANQIKAAFEQTVNALTNEKYAAEKKAKELADKVAHYETTIEKQAEEAKLDAKFASWGGRVVEEVIARLKTESAK
jgi:hypothetical protein